MQLHIKTFRQLTIDELYAALAHIGVEVDDFLLKNEYFTRPKHEPIHGIGHIYRTMIGCALLGYLLQKPRIALLAFVVLTFMTLVEPTTMQIIVMEKKPFGIILISLILCGININ